MSSRSSFSLTKALSEAVGGLPAAWSGAWAALLLLWAVGTFGPLAAFHHHHAPLVAGAVGLVSGVLKVMMIGALYRIALFGKTAKAEGLGFGGLQLAMPELRLVVANIVASLFILVVFAAVFIVFAMGLSMSGIAGDGNSLGAVRLAFCRHRSVGDWVLIGYVLASAALLIFVALKFTLLHAANIAQRRLVTLNALGLSSGQVGKLFAGLLIVVLPFVIVAVGVMHHFAPQIRLAHAMPYPWMGQRMHILLHGGMMLLGIAVLAPVLIGFFASAYRQIIALRGK